MASLSLIKNKAHGEDAKYIEPIPNIFIERSYLYNCYCDCFRKALVVKDGEYLKIAYRHHERRSRSPSEN
jgi:hypothetical protein